jgi:hypothetical protein
VLWALCAEAWEFCHEDSKRRGPPGNTVAGRQGPAGGAALGEGIAKGWYAPLGGLLMLASSSFALGAFPMDDVWHRIFGQDVTLWGPTHLVLIGGAGLATVGALILLAEGARSRGHDMPRRETRGLRFRQVALAGSFLVALSTFQAEFDFSVPEFRLLWHPILLMLAAGVGLVTARLTIGRGGALYAVGVFVLIRGVLSIYVGPLTGHTALHFPLYIVEALVVEAVGSRMNTERPIPFGAVAGLGIGTLGLAAEWGWSNVWYTTPWTSALAPEGIVAGLLAAVAGGVIGACVGGCLRMPVAERRPETRWAPAAAAVVTVALFAWALPMHGGPGVRASVTLTDAAPAPNRTVNADVKLDPPEAAKDAEWLNATAWQGGGSVVESLEEVGPGEYRTTTPIPVHDSWKSTLRLQKDRTVAGLPIYMPADPAIPVKGVPAAKRFTRTFVLDRKNLLGEQTRGVSGALTLIAYLVVLAIGLGLIAALAWGLSRFARREGAVA